MFVRRLVSGVRSSCDASETQLALGERRLLEGGQHRIEAGGEPRKLVAAAAILDPAREVAGRRDVLARRGEAPDRR